MLRTMLKSRLAGVTVTRADVDVAGSVVVDHDLMDAADLLPGEQVVVVGRTGEVGLPAYVLPGERGSGVLGIHGDTHRLAAGDLVTLVSFAVMDDAQSRAHRARVVSVDAGNRVAALGGDAEPEADSLQAAANGRQQAETDDAARLDALIQAEA